MNTQLLLVGEDKFFQSPELFGSNNVIQVASSDEALALINSFDFQAIIACDGHEILRSLRDQGKHTPFLNISHVPSAVDCCGGHMSPEASSEEKSAVLGQLMSRNHATDCR